ncbi:MAG: PHP domain-containing protein [archaeon]|nr:PHP domain-containing protein [archaeon]
MERMGKADTHVHTNYSGYNKLGPLRFPESVIDPSVQVDLARKNGIDVLCITDHNEVAGGFVAEKYAKKFDDIEIVVGDEVMTDQGEIIGLWLTEKVKKFLSPEETVDIIHEQGGLAIAPHPFSVHVDGIQEKIFELPLEGIEILNGGHPDRYSNMFAKKVSEMYPGRWATTSGSDAHSVYTAGFNWTEFEGRTAEEFRKAILNKKTVAVGEPAPVLGQVQWSMDVVAGGQKMLKKSLRHELEEIEDNYLVQRINEIPDVLKALGIVGGYMYRFPPVSMFATLLSTMYLRHKASVALKNIDERTEKVKALIEEMKKNGI